MPVSSYGIVTYNDVEFAGADANPLDVALRAAEVFGKDIGKSILPRMNW